MSLQLVKNPIVVLGAPNMSKFDVVNTIWESFVDGRELSGVWGYTD